MASQPGPSPTTAPTLPWGARAGLSGKLLVIGGLAGIIVAFLPLMSVSIRTQEGPGGDNPFQMLGGRPTTGSGGFTTFKVAVVEDWRGKVGLAGYLAALILAFVLYPPNGLGQKALCWAGVGAGLLVSVLAILLLLLALYGSADLMGMGNVMTDIEFGAVLNIVAGVMVAAGGFLKAREEKLI